MKISRMFGISCVSLMLLLIILVWLFGAGDVWTFCSELAQQASKIPKGGIKVPMKEKQGFVFVRGILNGRRDVNLLVDTGCSGTTIDHSLISELKLPLLSLPRNVEDPDLLHQLKRASVPELKIGDLMFHSLPVVIDDLQPSSCNAGYRIDGILGQNAIGYFATTFDVRGNAIIFENSDKLRIPVKAFRIECVTSHEPVASFNINNKLPQTFTIDTGCKQSQLPKFLASRLLLKITPANSKHFYGSGRPRGHGWVKVSEVNSGDLRIQDMWFNVDLFGGNAENMASLGYDFLKKYRWTMNLRKNVIFLEPYQIDTLEKLQDQIMLLIDTSKYEAALKELDSGIRQSPKNAKLRMLRAEALYQQKRYSECVKELDYCIELGSTEKELYLERALVYEKIGQHNAAVQNILKVILMLPNDPFARLECGRFLIQISAYAQAIDQFNEALKLQSDVVQIYLARATAYEKLREYKTAFEDYDTAVKLNPNQADSYNNRAWARNLTGKNFDKSIEDCNKAIKIDPNSSGAYRNRAIAYIGKSDYVNALLDLNKSLIFDSSSERAGRTYYFRSIVDKKLGKNDLSQQDMNKSKQLGYDSKED